MLLQKSYQRALHLTRAVPVNQPDHELLVQAPPERFLALTQRVLALLHARLGGVKRLALARREPLLVLERAHVAIDLREVLGELRLARAQVRARGADHGRIQAEPPGDFER